MSKFTKSSEKFRSLGLSENLGLLWCRAIGACVEFAHLETVLRYCLDNSKVVTIACLEASIEDSSSVFEIFGGFRVNEFSR